MSTMFLLQTTLLIGIHAVDISKDIIEGNNVFGCDLSEELQDASSTNIWISPFCITSCFGLIYPGSGANTQIQIANVMQYPTLSITPSDITQQFFTLQQSIESTYDGSRQHEYDNRASIIGIANKIYASRSLTLKDSYIDALNDGTQSFIDYNFDFSADNATAIINQWVQDNTNGLIDSIIPPQQDISLWRFVAMNAIYLNGSFQSQFKSSMTSSHTFYTNAERATQVTECHLMHQIDYFDYHSNGDYQFLKFPFTDSHDLFVLFVLPIKDDGWITDHNVIKTAIDTLESTYIALAIPRISITETYTLNDPLQQMGMKDAFSADANFSGISNDSLMIDSVIHKTMIEMDEKGLVAAAVTFIGMKSLIVTEKPTPILFKADHRFQMFIIDGFHDNAVLFMGQINNPGIVQGRDAPVYDEADDPIWNDFSGIYGSDRGTESPITTTIVSSKVTTSTSATESVKSDVEIKGESGLDAVDGGVWLIIVIMMAILIVVLFIFLFKTRKDLQNATGDPRYVQMAL